MDTLKLNKETARKLYPDTPEWFREVLEENFDKKTLLGDILERVTGFESACEELGTTPEAELSHAQDEYERSEIRIKTVAKALREGKPEKDCFYYPYFYRSSGGGFSYGVYACDNAYSLVGARLRVDSSDKARHLGKIMLEDYKVYLLGE